MKINRKIWEAVLVSAILIPLGDLVLNKGMYIHGDPIRHDAQLNMLRDNVRAYRLDTGRLPSDLAELLASEIENPASQGPYVSDQAISNRWGIQITIETRSDGGFILRDLGKDGELGGTGQNEDLSVKGISHAVDCSNATRSAGVLC